MVQNASPVSDSSHIPGPPFSSQDAFAGNTGYEEADLDSTSTFSFHHKLRRLEKPVVNTEN